MGLEIKTLDEAKQIWDDFYKQYETIGQYKEPHLLTQEEIQGPHLTQEEIHLIQQRRARARGKSSAEIKVPVVLGTDVSSEFKYFLAKKTIKTLLNLQDTKLKQLETAMREGDWGNAIFQDEQLHFLAFTLCQSKRITQQQLYTILERAEVTKDFQLQETYPILDENGQFTTHAEEILLPQLSRQKPEPYPSQGLLTDAERESFRLLIAQLPKSEQVFYTTDRGRYAKSDSEKPEKGYLGEALAQLDAAYIGEKYITHLSFGVRDAMGIARYGADEYIRAIPRLGIQAIDDIEYAVRHKVRPAAIAYPGTVPYPENIHDYPEVIDYEATTHDFGHSIIMSTIPKYMLAGIHRFIDISRETLGYKWSKEIWTWTDCDFLYLLKHAEERRQATQPGTSLEIKTQLFCQLLNDGTISAPTSRGYVSEMNPVGIGIFLDMIKNKEAWLKLNINPDSLIAPFKDSYEKIKTFYEKYHTQLENNDSKLNIFIFQCLFILKNKNAEALFEPLLAYINHNKEEISKKIKFKKVMKKEADPPESVNTIYAEFDSGKLTYDLMKDKLFPSLDSSAVAGLLKIIRDGNQLTDVLSGFLEEKRLSILSSLEANDLRSIIQDGSQLGRVIYLFPEDQRLRKFMELEAQGGADYLKNLIQTISQLSKVLSWFPKNQHEELIRNNLKKGLIQNSSDLAYVLSRFPEDQRWDVFKQIEKIEQSGEEKDYLTTLIKCGDDLFKILSLFPKEQRWAELEKFLTGRNLSELIGDEDELRRVLSLFPENKRKEQFDALGGEAFVKEKSKIKGKDPDPDELNRILNNILFMFPKNEQPKDLINHFIVQEYPFQALYQLPENERLNKLKEFEKGVEELKQGPLGGLISGGRYPHSLLISLISLYPEAQRLDKLATWGGGDLLKKVIKTVQDLHEVLSCFPEGKRLGANCEVFKAFENVSDLKKMIRYSFELADVLSLFPENQRLGKFVALGGADYLKTLIAKYVEYESTDIQLKRVLKHFSSTDDKASILKEFEIPKPESIPSPRLSSSQAATLFQPSPDNQKTQPQTAPSQQPKNR